MSDLIHNPNNYDEISDIVRKFCADRLYDLERSLRPWIDGSFGDISPAHITGYVSVLRELGRLYEAQKRPRQDQGLSLKEVEAMLQAAREEADARIQAAVVETELRVRQELEAAATKSIESAKQTALAKLTQLQQRTPGSRQQ
jgi:hypothetical protein